VQAIANRMLAHLGKPEAELSVLLTSDSFIRELNAEHRGKDRPTDVLAFSQLEGETQPTRSEPQAEAARALLGDVVISLDTAEKQAKQRGHRLLDEVRFLLAHGILHLFGYDHQTDAEEAEMDAMTRRLVAASGTRGKRASARGPARRSARTLEV
jgi:probable rRNA maturation factor